MNDLSRRVANLTPEKRALLERRLLGRAGAGAADAQIRRRLSNDPCLLSFAQQRLWFLDQMEPGTYTYNAAVGMRIKGRLLVDPLKQALDAILDRHEILRTVYIAAHGHPLQKVLKPVPLELRTFDLRKLPPAVREAAAQRLVTKEVQSPFDLARDLMLRPTLFRLDDDIHILLLTTHHIASDGWSRGIIFRELGLLYNSFVAGRPANLPELPIQYTDFALWQRQWLQGEVLEKQVAYWKQRLAGAVQVFDMPTDHPRPAVQTFRGAHLPVTLPAALYEELKALSRQSGATLYMTLLAAFMALLHGHTGQEDILAGSPIAGRNHVEVEGLIGFFVNTLVLRTDLSGNPTFRQLLGRVKESTLGAFAHPDLPFEKVVETLRPRRDPSRNPLFQVNFRAQTSLAPPPRLMGLEVTSLDFDPRISRFDLAAEFWATPEVFGGYFEYNTDLFEAATIERMAANFEKIIRCVASQPDATMESLKAQLAVNRVRSTDEGAGAHPLARSRIPRRGAGGP
jgi:hypothetical protein